MDAWLGPSPSLSPNLPYFPEPQVRSHSHLSCSILPATESHRREGAASTPWDLTQPLEKRNSFSNISPPSCLPLYWSKNESPTGSSCHCLNLQSLCEALVCPHPTHPPPPSHAPSPSPLPPAFIPHEVNSGNRSPGAPWVPVWTCYLPSSSVNSQRICPASHPSFVCHPRNLSFLGHLWFLSHTLLWTSFNLTQTSVPFHPPGSIRWH